MKAIMYHYIRPSQNDFPFFKYLHVDDFLSQLDWFGKEFGFLSKKDFLKSIQEGVPRKGIVLTFDDGLSDHYDHVFPILQSKGLWGIFYIPTGFYQSQKILDVHRIHLLLGRRGGIELLKALTRILNTEMLSHIDIENFKKTTYAFQTNDTATTIFKKTLNYYISYEWREKILNQLMNLFFSNTQNVNKSIYVTPKQIKIMHEAGMVIGSHSVNHFVFSKLDITAQIIEIKESFRLLEAFTQEKPYTFCYPYGGFHSFTHDTEQILCEEGSIFSFNVEPRDITLHDLQSRPQALPRYDCNMFPFGKVSTGPIEKTIHKPQN